MSENARVTAGRGQLYNSILDTIGNTPCVRVKKGVPEDVRLYVKAEFFNPAGSVKDRLAVSIIEEAETAGLLQPGQTVVEATSGNTGVGLAMVCAAKGHQFVATMSDSFSVERRKIMRGMGAKNQQSFIRRIERGEDASRVLRDARAREQMLRGRVSKTKQQLQYNTKVRSVVRRL